MKPLLNKINLILFAKGWLLKILIFSYQPVFAQTDTYVKNITAKCVVEKVFLNVVVNGINENTTYTVERSIDGSNFETIGTINFIGFPAPIDLLYSYVDETPLKVNSYYRLSNYNNLNESNYSMTVNVFPVATSAQPGDASNLQANKN